jgi:four helix bundle protein
VISDKFEANGYNADMNQGTQNYKDLLVWQKGIVLAKGIYRMTQSFPAEEKFGLVSQMRRAAVSIPSNLAEGQARHTAGEFVQFISHAEGSAAELDTQLILSVELGFCKNATALPVYELIDEIRRMLNALRRAISRRK